MLWLVATLLAAPPLSTVAIARSVSDARADPRPTVSLEAIVVDTLRDFSDLAPVDARPTVSDDRLRSCGADPNCLAVVLEPVGAARVVLVIVNYAERPPMTSVEVIDLAQRRVVASNLRATPGAIEDEVRAIVDETSRQAGHQRGARLSIDVIPPESEVVLEPTGPLAPAQRQRTVAPGHYVLTVSAEGYASERQELDLAVGDRRALTIALTEAPALYERWWFWTAVGVVAVGATVGGLAAAGVFDEGCYGACAP